MLFWILAALLTALAVFVLLRPLARKSKPSRARATYDLAIYRDQLDEITRDIARGVLAEPEAVAARLEIERRLLASQPRKKAEAAPGLSRRAIRTAVATMMIAVPALTLALYLRLGSPSLADAPLAAREVDRKVLADDGSIDMAKAKSMLETRLMQTPDSLEGWVLLARTDAALGDWAGVHAASERTLTLSKRAPDMLEAYGDLLVAEAQGEVTPQAVALLQEAVAAKPDMFRSRYYLALAKAQHGDIPAALEGWHALLAEAPKDASWATAVKNVVAEAERQLSSGTAAPVPAPETGQQQPPEMAGIMSLPANERLNAIRGMVAGLAARLEQEPDDLDGWKKLARSYRVLGDAQKSAEAYGRAAALAPTDSSLLIQEADALQSALPEDAPVPLPVIDLYHQVVARDPDQPQALWFLGLAEKQAGHDETAAKHWQRLLAQLKPDTPEAKAVQHQLDTLGTAPKP